MGAGGEEREMKRVEINGELGKNIPFDVFAAEILPRLPAEELQKLKIVCTDWLKLLSSPGFARVHLEWGIRPIRVLMPFESAIVECNSREETKRIPYAPYISSSKRIAIMGSCDGLLCLVDHPDRKIAVFNPSTGKYFGMQIAKSQGTYISCYWFGRVAGKYLLVLGFGLPYKLEVYNFSSESDLQLIQSLYFDLHLPHPTFFNCSTDRGLFFRGAVHWPARMVDYGVNDERNDGLWGAIIAFHLEQNKWFKILLPPRCRRSGFKEGYTLGLADECLFVILMPNGGNSSFELWIMKEYGVEQSWTKWANIEGLHQYKSLYPLGFLPNGDLLLDAVILHAYERHLIQYNFSDYKLLQRDDCSPRLDAIICADTLLSPTTVLSS